MNGEDTVDFALGPELERLHVRPRRGSIAVIIPLGLTTGLYATARARATRPRDTSAGSAACGSPDA